MPHRYDVCLGPPEITGDPNDDVFAIGAGTGIKLSLGIISAANFGTVGDGVTDDTAALQRAINAAITLGYSLFIPAGTYKYSHLTITVDALAIAQRLTGFALRGAGRNSTILVPDGSHSPALDIRSDIGSGGMAHVTIADIQCYYTANGNIVTAQLWNVLHFSIERSIFYGDKCALSIQGSGNGTVIDTETYLSGPIPANPFAALWIGHGNSAPYADDGVLTSSGPINFIGGQSASTNNVPAAIIEGDAVRYGSFSINFDGWQYGCTGATVDAAVKIDGIHTSVALHGCYSESCYNNANNGSDILIGSHAKPKLVSICDQTSHGHGNGVNYQKYAITVASCASLRIKGGFFSKQGFANGYNGGIVHFLAGFPVSTDLVSVSGIGKDDVTGPLYADDNGIIPSTRTGAYEQRIANNDSFYAPQFPQLVTPFDPRFATSSANPGNLTLAAVRVIVPLTGILHGLSIFIVGTSGNIQLAVYDTGDASAGNRSRLYTSGSIAAGAGGAWQTVDPNIAVTAGQELDLSVIPDNAVITFARLAGNALATLPAGFLPVSGGALPKLAWQNGPGSFTTPATIAEAGCNGLLSSFYLIIARVTPT